MCHRRKIIVHSFCFFQIPLYISWKVMSWDLLAGVWVFFSNFLPIILSQERRADGLLLKKIVWDASIFTVQLRKAWKQQNSRKSLVLYCEEMLLLMSQTPSRVLRFSTVTFSSHFGGTYIHTIKLTQGIQRSVTIKPLKLWDYYY